MSALFQINEDDLAELERTLPQFSTALFSQMNPRLRVQFVRVQKILSNVRWGYGPPSHVERVDASDDESYQDS